MTTITHARTGRAGRSATSTLAAAVVAGTLAAGMLAGVTTAADPERDIRPVVAQVTAPGAPLEQAWEVTPAEDDYSFAVGVEPGGRVWVTVAQSGRFAIHERDGTFVEFWGAEGAGDGEFDFRAPWGDGFGGIAFRPDGGFYVADTGNVRIQQFDADRAFVRSWGSFGTQDGQFVAPVTIRLGPDGQVFVHDFERTDVQVFTADGAFLRTAVAGITEMGPSMAVDRYGTVHVVDETDRTLLRVGTDGAVAPIAQLGAVLSFATGIALTPSGGFLIASERSGTSASGPEHLVELDAAGNLLALWPNGGWELALDAEGGRIFMPMLPADVEPGTLRALDLPGA